MVIIRQKQKDEIHQRLVNLYDDYEVRYSRYAASQGKKMTLVHERESYDLKEKIIHRGNKKIFNWCFFGE